MNITNIEIKTITKNMYCLHHYNKPIKGVSTYKVSELNNIAKLLNIANYENYKKKELYELIQLELIWEHDRL